MGSQAEPAFEKLRQACSSPCTYPATEIEPKSCPAKSEHANVMTEATPMHSFWRFYRDSGMQHILPSFGQVAIELWREKIMYMHSAKFQLALLRLGQNRGQQPHHQNLPVEQFQNKSHQKANFSKEWTCIRRLRISHKVSSAGFLPQVPTFIDLLLYYSSFWGRDSDVIVRQF